MSTVSDFAKCTQCGFEFGNYEFNCRTNEEDFVCRRCGYTESLAWIIDEDGNRIGWEREIFDGHGAIWVAPRDGGISSFCGLHSVKDVEQAAQRLRASIAAGEFDAEASYVTRWNTDAKRVEVVAGKWVELPEEADLESCRRGAKGR